jgi:LysM repeat protein
MYDGTETKMRRWRDAIASLPTPTDLRTTERSPVNMERAVESFHRMRAKKAGMKGKSQVRRPAEEIVRKLFGVALMLGIGIAVVPTDATARSPIACGTIYTVARGDTLFKIAERAFGNGWLYKQIFEVNSNVLPNSASVEIGNELLVPCLDGTGKVVREDALAQYGGGGVSEAIDLRNETEAQSLPQSAIDDGVTSNLWQLMTPEERALWQS